MKNKFIYLLIILMLTISCEFFRETENELQIPKEIPQDQLQETRYNFKKDKSYKEKYLTQNKSDSAIITIYNIINYEIKDDGTSIGEGFKYYIFDISVDNFTNQPFSIGAFTRSCHLTNEDPTYLYSNVGFALKMYHLQSDSTQINMEYTNRFYADTMEPKEFYRTKLFAYEISIDDKNPLIFHYRIGNQKFEYKVRD